MALVHARRLAVVVHGWVGSHGQLWSPVTCLVDRAELESGREVRDEFLRMIEKTKEYNAYEHDVDFEMSMVRRR